MYEENCYFKSDIKRYETKTIATEIPFAYRVVMWEMIENMVQKGTEADYLQIFNFRLVPDSKTNNDLQQITHSQEVPEYEETITIPLIGKGLNKVKIYVIDDGIGYATMCYPDER